MSRWCVVACLGLLVGVGASAADALQGFGADNRPWVRVLSILLNSATVWVLTAFVAGRVARTWRQAVAAGSMSLYLAVVGYYTYGVTLGDRIDVGLGALTGVTGYWLLMATVAGPVFGVLGRVTQLTGLSGPLAALSVPAVAVLEVVGRYHISLNGFQIDPLREWTCVALLLAAMVCAAWTLTRAAGSIMIAALNARPSTSVLRESDGDVVHSAKISE